MPTDEVAPPAHGLASTDVASAIYGSMLVTVLLAAQSGADVAVARVGLYVVLGILAFWLTHIWATLVGHAPRRADDARDRRSRRRARRARCWAPRWRR